MIVANMATYPGRARSTLESSLASIARQVDRVNLCMNEFTEVPAFVARQSKVHAYVPDRDYKDVGKFLIAPDECDDVFYVDDDIDYPRDYVEHMLALRDEFAEIEPILGLHGVIYPDAFDGTAEVRRVFSFYHRLASHRVVNQLGTGTVYCKGWQAPGLETMAESERFVDVRFAVHAHSRGFPMLCIAREAQWMKALASDTSIFESFTKQWPLSVTREVQPVAGYARLPLDVVEMVEGTTRQPVAPRARSQA